MYEKCYIYIIGVMEIVIEFVKLYGVDEKKVEMVVIFYDYVKCRVILEMEEIIKCEDLLKDLFCYNKELWYVFVGVYLVEKEVGIMDFEIL